METETVTEPKDRNGTRDRYMQRHRVRTKRQSRWTDGLATTDRQAGEQRLAEAETQK